MKIEAEQIVGLPNKGIEYKEMVETVEDYLQDANDSGYTRGHDIGFDAGCRSERQANSVSSESGTGNGERNITRVEVIDQEGRSYVNWDAKNSVFTSIQDEGRTLKVFIKDKE